MSLPAALQRGSVVNQAWLDMDAFLKALPEEAAQARFSFTPELRVVELSDILHPYWETGRELAQIGVPDAQGDTHWFTLHAPFHGEARPILEVSFGEGFGGTDVVRSEMDRQPYYRGEAWVEPIPPMNQGKVWAVVREKPEGDPVGLMVECSIPMERLVEVMSLLEAMKAESFTLDFI
ncbi:MAG: hypothetical protein ACPG31_05520 [Planctomycetota bacterium]